MTIRTDNDHFTSSEILLTSYAESLPSSTTTQFDYFAQLFHCRYVLINIEKDLHFPEIGVLKSKDK